MDLHERAASITRVKDRLAVLARELLKESADKGAEWVRVRKREVDQLERRLADLTRKFQ